MDYGPRVLSRPQTIIFAGFQGNTYTLQQAGWEFSANQENYDRDAVSLMMRHTPSGLVARTGSVDYSRMDMRSAAESQFVFHVNWMTDRNLRYDTCTLPDDLLTYRPVDMQPQFIREVQSLEDMNLFATPLARTNEVIIDPNSVPELMEQILTLQDPARKDHFKKVADEARRGQGNTNPRQQFHAQILSLVA